jgi:hypothetical protein
LFFGINDGKLKDYQTITLLAVADLGSSLSVEFSFLVFRNKRWEVKRFQTIILLAVADPGSGLEESRQQLSVTVNQEIS